MPDVSSCLLRSVRARSSRSRFGAVAHAASCFLLLGCPQLLSDDFDVVSAADRSQPSDSGLPPPPSGQGGTPATASAGAGGSAAGGQGGGGNGEDAGGQGSAAGASTGGTSGSAGASGAGPLESLRAALAHRYSFEGTGTSALDGAGTAHGVIQATTLTGSGYLSLSGGSFVNLPNGLLSESNDRTLEAWVVWNGGAAQQRIFDFGSSTAGEDGRGNGASFLFLSPDTGSGVLCVGYSLTGISGFTFMLGQSGLPTGTLRHVAVVVDSQANTLALYVAGQRDASTTMTTRMSQINDVNDWLGVSQISAQPFLDGQIHEFRIYRAALSAELLALSFELGPDTSELGP